MVAQSAAFTTAVKESRQLKAKPSNDELLEVSYTASIVLAASEERREKMSKL